MSDPSNLSPIPIARAHDAEPATDVTEFFDRQLDQHRERAVRSRRRFFRRRTKLTVGLFLATCLSTFLVGLQVGDIEGIFAGQLGVLFAVGMHLLQTGQLLPGFWPYVANGLVFSGCVMGILLAHEMGHFVQALRHKVPATLPFFIPFPISPFGTMGAVIIQDGARANRRQLFDIAVSGPIAGLVVAIPVLCYGIATSRLGIIGPPPPGEMNVIYGDPLLIRWIVQAFHGPYGPGIDIGLNAPLFAGWVGIFITALNLLPVGQLDGGHILYTLIGRKAHYVAYVILGTAFAWMAYTQQLHYALIVVLLLVFGPRHPPTANDHVPLGVWRTVLGWAVLAFVIVGFTPTPIMM
ncbi:MAG: site-2 protease family protein [Planctomycetota bacterium]|nr:site-2 protease family protein [Planctomycetaceae bacterium]MDQ3332327.1 site-2 protease family protein [Planctomycetota bacterium]